MRLSLQSFCGPLGTRSSHVHVPEMVTVVAEPLNVSLLTTTDVGLGELADADVASAPNVARTIAASSTKRPRERGSPARTKALPGGRTPPCMRAAAVVRTMVERRSSIALLLDHVHLATLVPPAAGALFHNPLSRGRSPDRRGIPHWSHKVAFGEVWSTLRSFAQPAPWPREPSCRVCKCCVRRLPGRAGPSRDAALVQAVIRVALVAARASRRRLKPTGVLGLRPIGQLV